MCVVVVCAVINMCWITVPTVVLTHLCSSNPTTQGPDLILIDSNTASVTFTLEKPWPDTAKAFIFLVSKKPIRYNDYLEEKTMHGLPGRLSPYNYNYVGDDSPIYLFAGSKLIYKISVTTENTSCPARLHLFNDYKSYDRFKTVILQCHLKTHPAYTITKHGLLIFQSHHLIMLLSTLLSILLFQVMYQ